MCEKSALRVNVVQSTLWTTLPVSAALLIMSEWVCVVSQRDIRCVDSAVVERFSLTHECVYNIILLASKDDSVLFGLNKHQWDRFTQTTISTPSLIIVFNTFDFLSSVKHKRSLVNFAYNEGEWWKNTISFRNVANNSCGPQKLYDNFMWRTEQM